MEQAEHRGHRYCHQDLGFLGILNAFPALLLSVLLITVQTSSATAEIYSEFHTWLGTQGVKGPLPPDQSLVLVNRSDSATWTVFEPNTGVPGLLGDADCGIFAAKDLNAGDIILNVPNSAILWAAGTEEIFPFPDASDEALLAARLLREKAKGEASVFAPYLKMLPKSVPAAWLTLDAKDYKELQLRTAIETARNCREEVTAWIAEMKPSTCGHASSADIVWAYSIVATRALLLPVNKAKGRLNATRLVEQGRNYPRTRAALVPFGDMFNRHPRLDHVIWDERVFPDRLEVLLDVPVDKGQQLFVASGWEGVVNQVVRMGYLSPTESFDTLPLFNSIAEMAKWYDRKYKVCSSLTERRVGDKELCRTELEDTAREVVEALLRDSGRPLSLIDEDGGDEPLVLIAGTALGEGLAIIFAKFWAITRSQQNADEAGDPSYAGGEGPMGSARAHGLRTVKRRCKELLGSFATSEEKDRAILAGAADDARDGHRWLQSSFRETLRPELELILKFRIGMKQRLQLLIEDINGLLYGISEEEVNDI